MIAGTVTFDPQPEDLTLSGSAVITVAGSSVTLTLRVRNDFPRALFNLKGVTTSLSQGDQTGSAFPGGGPSFVYFGPQVMGQGDEIERELVIENISDLSTPLSIALAFEDAPMLFATAYSGTLCWVDTSLSLEYGMEIFSGSADDGYVRQGAVSKDGLKLYLACKNEEEVKVMDLRNLEVSDGPALTGETYGSIGGLALSPDGERMYCSVNTNAHVHGRNDDDGETETTVDLVVLRTSDLAELARVNMHHLDAESRTAQRVEVSPDGSTVAVLVSDVWDSKDNELWLFDRTSLAPVDTNPVEPGTQPVALSSGQGFAQFLVWSSESQKVFVGFNGYKAGLSLDSVVDVVDVSDLTVSQISPGGLAAKTGVMAYKDGQLYYPNDKSAGPGFTVIDVNAGTQAQPATGAVFASHCTGVVCGTGEQSDRYFIVYKTSEVGVFDLATNDRVDVDNDISNGVTDLDLSSWFGSHCLLMTPF